MPNSTIPYYKKDYQDIREELIKLTKEKLSTEQWSDFNESDLGMVLLENIASVADLLSYNIDHQANELYIDRAQERKNIISLANLIGYKLEPNTPSSCEISLTNNGLDKIYLREGETTLDARYNNETIQFIISSIPLPYANGIAHNQTADEVGIIQGTWASFNTTPILFSDLNNNSAITNYSYNFDYNTFMLEIENTSWCRNFFTIEINGEKWTAKDSFISSVSNSKDYVIKVSPENYILIEFGDNINGLRPSLNDTILIKFLETKGTIGNLPANSINAVTGGIFVIDGNTNSEIEASVYNITVSQPIPSQGGSFYEPIDFIRTQAPAELTTLQRGVTKNDIKILMEGYPGISKALVWGEREEIPVSNSNFIAPSVYTIKITDKIVETTNTTVELGPYPYSVSSTKTSDVKYGHILGYMNTNHYMRVTAEDIINKYISTFTFETLNSVKTDTGHGTSFTTNTLTNTSATWTPDEWKDKQIIISYNNGTTETHLISGNTSTQINIVDTWNTIPTINDGYLLRPVLFKQGYKITLELEDGNTEIFVKSKTSPISASAIDDNALYVDLINDVIQSTHIISIELEDTLGNSIQYSDFYNNIDYSDVYKIDFTGSININAIAEYITEGVQQSTSSVVTKNTTTEEYVPLTPDTTFPEELFNVIHPGISNYEMFNKIKVSFLPTLISSSIVLNDGSELKYNVPDSPIYMSGLNYYIPIYYSDNEIKSYIPYPYKLYNVTTKKYEYAINRDIFEIKIFKENPVMLENATLRERNIVYNVLKYLDSIKVITTNIFFVEPKIIPIGLNITIKRKPNAFASEITAKVRNELLNFFDINSQSFGNSIRYSDIIGIIENISGVDYVYLQLKKWDTLNNQYPLDQVLYEPENTLKIPVFYKWTGNIWTEMSPYIPGNTIIGTITYKQDNVPTSPAVDEYWYCTASSGTYVANNIYKWNSISWVNVNTFSPQFNSVFRYYPDNSQLNIIGYDYEKNYDLYKEYACNFGTDTDNRNDIILKFNEFPRLIIKSLNNIKVI